MTDRDDKEIYSGDRFITIVIGQKSERILGRVPWRFCSD